ncbi:MAG: EF-Tu/IF-2/RF-3 family GTPase, partial [bacterium]
KIPIVALQVPIGEGPEFSGLIDIVEQKAYMWTSDGSGSWEEKAIPEEYLGVFRKRRGQLEEVLAEQSDEIAELYLEGKPVPVELMKKAIRKGVLSYTLVPAFCGSAYKNKGVDFLLDAVVDYLPSPVEMPPIQGWHAKTQEQVMLDPDPEGHLVAYAFKVATDPFVGRLVYVRIYSGRLRKGELVLNATRGVRERLGRVLRMHSNYREDVEELSAGELGAIVGVKNTFTGDTLCKEEYPVILEALFVPETVMSVAIEPRSQQDQDK